jgi:hypothetical protein
VTRVLLQQGKILIFDFVDVAIAHKHILGAALYARFRALAVSHRLPAVLDRRFVHSPAIAVADLPRPCLLCGGHGHYAGGHYYQT